MAKGTVQNSKKVLQSVTPKKIPRGVHRDQESNNKNEKPSGINFRKEGRTYVVLE